jgi:hypothetical protein
MFPNPIIAQAAELLTKVFGGWDHSTKYVTIWHLRHDFSIAIENERPEKDGYAQIWLPYPPVNQLIPEIAQEYAPDSGHNNNLHNHPKLEKSSPVLKLRVTCDDEFAETIAYIATLASGLKLPEVKSKSAPLEHREHLTGRLAISHNIMNEVWEKYKKHCYVAGCKVKDNFRFVRKVPRPFDKASNNPSNLLICCEKHEREYYEDFYSSSIKPSLMP